VILMCANLPLTVKGPDHAQLLLFAVKPNVKIVHDVSDEAA